MPRAVELVLALLALVMLPCLVALAVITADRWRLPSLPDQWRWATPPWVSWQERWTLIRLERMLAREHLGERFLPTGMGRSTQPPIEQIAGDLRRLGSLRLGLASRNPVWHEAVRQAYDERLRLACGGLGIAQHLSELDGLDLEIERVRVEGALRAAGLYFGGTDNGPRQGHGQDRR